RRLVYEEILNPADLLARAFEIFRKPLIKRGKPTIDLRLAAIAAVVGDLAHLRRPAFGLREHVGDAARKLCEQRALALGQLAHQIAFDACTPGGEDHRCAETDRALVDACIGELQRRSGADAALDQPYVEPEAVEIEHAARFRP